MVLWHLSASVARQPIFMPGMAGGARADLRVTKQQRAGGLVLSLRNRIRSSAGGQGGSERRDDPGAIVARVQ